MESTHNSSPFAEKRRHPRVKVSIHVDWDVGGRDHYRDRITSLSVGGCFIQTRVLAIRGQTIFIYLWLAPDRQSVLQGRVIYNMENVGLGVEFESLSAEEVARIQALVAHYL
ncbi:MAG: PilZ domain-containing protein [Acidobacteria bacterium]|nr:PilZ domain-containing protein [Acidobacteriota bacterium]